MPLKIAKAGVFRRGLIVDGLSVTLKIPGVSLQKEVSKRLKALTSSERYIGPARKLRYEASYMFYASNVQERRVILIQAEPKGPNLPYLRVEYNPAHTDPAEIYAIVSLLLPDGWNYFIGESVVTKLDLAVDVERVRIRDLFIFMPGFRRTRQFFQSGNVQTEQSEELQTYDIGSYIGKKRLTVYDRVAAIKRKNQKNVHKIDVPTFPLTRFEMRLRPALAWSDMLDISNPFQNVLVRDFSAISSQEGEFLFRLFLRVAQVDGAHHAALSLPESVRKKFLKRVEGADQSWWDVSSIWDGYPDAVEDVVTCSAIDCKLS